MQYGVHCPSKNVQGFARSHWTPPLGNYLPRITLEAARATANKTTIKKCTNFASHFGCCGGVPVQYRTHCPRQLLAPYPLGGHRVDSKQNNDDKMHQLLWPFWWPWGCTGTIPRALPVGEVQGFTRSHWTPPSGKYCSQ